MIDIHINTGDEKETVITAQDEPDLTRPFNTIRGWRNIPREDWRRRKTGGRLDQGMRDYMDNPDEFTISTAHISYIEHWD